MQYTLERVLSDFLSGVFLIFFMNIEMYMDIYNGEKTYSATFSCHDLDTADELPVLNGTAVVNAMYSIAYRVLRPSQGTVNGGTVSK